MEKKLNEKIEDKEDTWSSIYDAMLVFASLFAFVAGMITGELILSVGGFVILIYIDESKKDSIPLGWNMNCF